MYQCEIAVGPLFDYLPESCVPCFKYVSTVPLSVAVGALIDVVELSGTIFSEVKTYEIDVSMTMHGRGPDGLVAAGVVRIEWYQFQSLVPVDFQ